MLKNELNNTDIKLLIVYKVLYLITYLNMNLTFYEKKKS